MNEKCTWNIRRWRRRNNGAIAVSEPWRADYTVERQVGRSKYALVAIIKPASDTHLKVQHVGTHYATAQAANSAYLAARSALRAGARMVTLRIDRPRNVADTIAKLAERGQFCVLFVEVRRY